MAAAIDNSVVPPACPCRQCAIGLASPRHLGPPSLRLDLCEYTIPTSKHALCEGNSTNSPRPRHRPRALCPGSDQTQSQRSWVSWVTTRQDSQRARVAHLCGVAPKPASSGKTHRHRLHRAGNRALHIATVVRLRYDPHSRAYAERRTTEAFCARNHPPEKTLPGPRSLPRPPR